MSLVDRVDTRGFDSLYTELRRCANRLKPLINGFLEKPDVAGLNLVADEVDDIQEALDEMISVLEEVSGLKVCDDTLDDGASSSGVIEEPKVVTALDVPVVVVSAPAPVVLEVPAGLTVEKRKPGRPKKVVDPSAPVKPRGRPRKEGGVVAQRARTNTPLMVNV